MENPRLLPDYGWGEVVDGKPARTCATYAASVWFAYTDGKENVSWAHPGGVKTEIQKLNDAGARAREAELRALKALHDHLRNRGSEGPTMFIMPLF